MIFCMVFALLVLSTIHMRSFVLLGALILMSCSVNSQSIKQAKGLEQSGNFRDAATAYHQFLFRKPSHKDARAGLQRTGQRVVDDLLGVFWAKYNLEVYRVAIKAYQDARDFELQIAANTTVMGTALYTDSYARSNGKWRTTRTAYERLWEEIHPRSADIQLLVRPVKPK